MSSDLHFRALYRPFPIEADRIDAALSDPSVLPFVAQRILTVLADWDPANYPYYQRRLAEFQARLSGSVLAGRQILRDIPVYNLTGYNGSYAGLVQIGEKVIFTDLPIEGAARCCWR